MHYHNVSLSIFWHPLSGLWGELLSSACFLFLYSYSSLSLYFPSFFFSRLFSPHSLFENYHNRLLVAASLCFIFRIALAVEFSFIKRYCICYLGAICCQCGLPSLLCIQIFSCHFSFIRMWSWYMSSMFVLLLCCAPVIANSHLSNHSSMVPLLFFLMDAVFWFFFLSFWCSDLWPPILWTLLKPCPFSAPGGSVWSHLFGLDIVIPISRAFGC